MNEPRRSIQENTGIIVGGLASLAKRGDLSEGPVVPKNIALRCSHTGVWSLTIDGVEFPWMISGDDGTAPQTGPVSSGHFPKLTITLVADHITVDHDFSTLDGPAS